MELRLPLGTQEQIRQYFLSESEESDGEKSSPRWQKLLSPISSMENTAIGIRKLSEELNVLYEVSKKRGFFFPSTLAVYQEIMAPTSQNDDFSVTDLIVAITGNATSKRSP